MMDNRKQPDLAFERKFGLVSEGIEFYLSDNSYLEIQGWNADCDSFTIILDHFEIGQLKDLLQKIVKETTD